MAKPPKDSVNSFSFIATLYGIEDDNFKTALRNIFYGRLGQKTHLVTDELVEIFDQICQKAQKLVAESKMSQEHLQRCIDEDILLLARIDEARRVISNGSFEEIRNEISAGLNIPGTVTNEQLFQSIEGLTQKISALLRNNHVRYSLKDTSIKSKDKLNAKNNLLLIYKRLDQFVNIALVGGFFEEMYQEYGHVVTSLTIARTLETVESGTKIKNILGYLSNACKENFRTGNYNNEASYLETLWVSGNRNELEKQLKAEEEAREDLILDAKRTDKQKFHYSIISQWDIGHSYQQYPISFSLADLYGRIGDHIHSHQNPDYEYHLDNYYEDFNNLPNNPRFIPVTVDNLPDFNRYRTLKQ